MNGLDVPVYHTAMYSTCLHCNAELGRNDVVEHFGVGRRLAFDQAKGRLWVVCPSCQRWNLTPLEERWEAIEECERLFRATRLRTSTDNIGLGRAAGGIDLVRIGTPQRKEIAATLPDPFEGDAHALLTAVYKDPRIEILVRLDAAKAAAPYEKPRLATMQHGGVDGPPITVKITGDDAGLL